VNAPVPIVARGAATAAGGGLLALIGLFSANDLTPDGRGFALAALGAALAALAWGGLAQTPGPTASAASWIWRRRLLSLAALVAGAAFAVGWIGFGARDDMWRWFGLFAASFSGVAVYCEAMARAAFEETPSLAGRWIAPVTLALALLAGAQWLNALVHMVGRPSPDLAMLLVVALFLGFYLKRKYWRLADRETAAPPSQPIRKHRRTIFLCLFAAPLALSLIGMGNTPWFATACATLAALSVTGGLMAEQWLVGVERRAFPPLDSH